MKNSRLRFPPSIVFFAITGRVLVLIALAGGAIFLLRSDSITGLVARCTFPSRFSPVIWGVSFFRFYNHFYCVPIAVVCSVILCYAVAIRAQKRNESLFFSLIIAASIFGFFQLFVQKIPPFFFLLYVAASAPIVFLTKDFRVPRKSWMCALICIPFLMELIFPHTVAYYLSSRRSRSRRVFDRVIRTAGPVYTAAAAATLACYLLTIAAINASIIPDNIRGNARRIAAGTYYCLQLDKARNYLIAGNQKKVRLEVYDVRDEAAKLFEVTVPVEEQQYVRINPEKRELYHFDKDRNKLLVLDLDSFRLKKESVGSMGGSGNAHVAFDNASNTIAVAREKGLMWMIDMATLRPMRTLFISDWTASLIFNKPLNAFILSYANRYPFIQIVSPDGRTRTCIDAKLYQAGIDFSPAHNELFVALPLAGKILVYAVPSLEPKRPIPSVFGVRNIAYDSAHDLIVAASLCSGYVDIIDRASGRSRKRMFVGYWLREVCLNVQKREAYISSPIGGLYSLNY